MQHSSILITIGVEHVLLSLSILFDYQTFIENSCIHDPEPNIYIFDLFDNLIIVGHLSVAREIGNHDASLHPILLKFALHNFLKLTLCTRDQADFEAFVSELFAEFQSDTIRSTCDEGPGAFTTIARQVIHWGANEMLVEKFK